MPNFIGKDQDKSYEKSEKNKSLPNTGVWVVEGVVHEGFLEEEPL